VDALILLGPLVRVKNREIGRASEHRVAIGRLGNLDLYHARWLVHVSGDSGVVYQIEDSKSLGSVVVVVSTTA
jgi:hypothetical protein